LIRLNSQGGTETATWTPNIRHPSDLGEDDVSENIIDLTTDMAVPEDVIVVYVGSDDLDGGIAGKAGPGGYAYGYSGVNSAQPWIDRVVGRGSAAAALADTSQQTDFSPWGGFISFDNSNRTWNFSLSTNDGVAGTEFLYVALHEMGHVLGIGTANSYYNLIESGTFLFSGQAVKRSNGGAEPVADGGHYRALAPGTFTEITLDSPKFGSFGQAHGTIDQDVLMLPGQTDTGSNFPVLTDFDLAGFMDIGWEINPDPSLAATSLSPSGVTLEWNSVSFKDYAVDRSTGLPSFSNVRASADGDTTTQSWSDPSPPSDQAFYQLDINDLASGAPAMGAGTTIPPAEAPAVVSAESEGFRVIFVYQEPRAVECEFH
jgi:hypothetical protein